MNRRTLTVREFLGGAVGLGIVSSRFVGGQTRSKGSAGRESSDSVFDTTRLQLGGATIEITFGSGGFDLPQQSIIAWVSKAAQAVTHYYDVFPIPLMRVRVNPSERQSGAFGGQTWGSDPPFTRIFVGRHTTSQQLHEDWLMTHEFVHTALSGRCRRASLD